MFVCNDTLLLERRLIITSLLRYLSLRSAVFRIAVTNVRGIDPEVWGWWFISSWCYSGTADLLLSEGDSLCSWEQRSHMDGRSGLTARNLFLNILKYPNGLHIATEMLRLVQTSHFWKCWHRATWIFQPSQQGKMVDILAASSIIVHIWLYCSGTRGKRLKVLRVQPLCRPT